MFGFLGCEEVADAERAAADQASRLAELERLLNDPDVPMQPDRIWSLVFEIAQHESAVTRRSATPA